MRLTDHSARSAPTACWDGLRGTVRCSSVAAVEQALPKSRARAGGHGIVLILRACDWSKYLDFIGLWARVHCRIVVLKSAKSRFSRVPHEEPRQHGWHPVGEKETAPFQFTFNGFLKVAFQGSRVTSDAGVILVRELDERLGLDAIITEHLRDSRQGLNTQFRLPDLLRQSVYSRLAGYEDLNDAVRLAADPAFRLIGSPKRWDRSAALTSTVHWFETELLTHEDNLVGLMAVNRDLIGQAETCDRAVRIVLDMDSSESPVHGQQEGSAYNGHFESVCYCPRRSPCA